jgi:predicted Holliday junction resolvase-like endonuclease
LPYFNAEVELAEIVIYPVVNAEERAKALEKINSIKNQIEAGADFGEMAKKYSEDGSARKVEILVGQTGEALFLNLKVLHFNLKKVRYPMSLKQNLDFILFNCSNVGSIQSIHVIFLFVQE